MPTDKCSLPGDASTEAKAISGPQQFSDVVKQRSPSPGEDNLKDEQIVKSPFRKVHFDEHRLTRRKGGGSTSQMEPSKKLEKLGNVRKVKGKDDLVKHMSNLPGYLQQLDKGESFQEKALNFGVLDWNRLEKYSNNALSGGYTDVSSSGSSFFLHKRHPPSHFSRPYSANEKLKFQDADISQSTVIEKNSESSQRNPISEFTNLHHSNMHTSEFERDIDQIVISEKECSYKIRKNEVPNSCEDMTTAKRKMINNRVELPQSSEGIDNKCCPDGQESVNLILPENSPKSNHPDLTVQTSETRFPSNGKSNEDILETLSAEVSSRNVHFEPLLRSKSPGHARKLEPLNVVSCSTPLLRSKSPGHARKLEPLNVVSCSSETTAGCSQCKYIESFTLQSKSLRGKGIDTPRTSDIEITESGVMKAIIASPSRRFSFNFGKISRSFSLKENSAVQGVSDTVESGIIRSEEDRHLSAEEIHSSAELYPNRICATHQPNGKETKNEHRTRRHSLTSIYKAPKKQSSEDLIGQTELDDVQSRHSSSNRLFGFSFGKMKKSVSFKEDFDILQLGSTTCVKSGQVRSEVSDCPVTPSKAKDNLHSKSRPTHLRRLLDPILKPRVTYPYSYPSGETSPSWDQNQNSFSNDESYDYSKPQETVVQALLQVTTKNGFPLFKLVVNNSSDILVAMKSVTPPQKHDVDSVYIFYSVHEIKKKSVSWINQVHKEKNYGFGYNVVGQMMGFSRFHPETSTDNFEARFTQKEFVLSSVDRRQQDRDRPELVLSRELASIIVMVPHVKSNDYGNQRNIGKELTGKEFFEYLEEEKYLFGKGENEKFHDTTVILSAASHGLPKSGVPTSLIQRWRSGGSCDCGGWDIGCKLHILTNENQSSKWTEPSLSSSTRNHFNLFNQGGGHVSNPLFTLAPFKKGMYSTEFSSSISLLQALSICIAAISSRQSFDFSELNSGVKILEPILTNVSGIQIHSEAQESPTKYIPPPPPSPVERV